MGQISADVNEISPESMLSSADTTVLTTPHDRFTPLPTVWLMVLEGLLLVRLILKIFKIYIV